MVGATVLLGGKGQYGTSQLAKCWGSIGICALERESRFLAGPVVSGIWPARTVRSVAGRLAVCRTGSID
jgi:hypothetical protein